MSEQLGSQVKKGFLWNFSENIVFKLIQFGIQLVLARILAPEDYGLSALVLAIVNIADVFVKAGFSSALIQKDDAKSIDFSSVCYFSLALAIICYIVIFICSPYIADYFGDYRIVGIMRVMSVSLIIGVYNSVQIAIIYKNLEFKRSFQANILGMLISATAGIVAACLGMGVWALVIQYIVNRLVTCFAFYFIDRWLPQKEFSFESIKSLFSYGWKLMVSSFFTTVSSDIYSLVIGKFFSKAQLGVYDTGKKIPANIGSTVASTMGSVLFPTFSKIQHDSNKMKEYLKTINCLSSVFIFPGMLGLAAMAEPLVRVILSEKWIEAVPIMQIACVLYSFYPIHLANLQIAKAVGRTDISMYQEIAKKVIDIIMLILTVRHGIVWVAAGIALSSIIALWINIEPNNRYIHYNTVHQLSDVMPSIIIGIVTALSMYSLGLFLNTSSLLLIVFEVCLGITVFCVLSMAFNRKAIKMVRLQARAILNH
jgi:O-antigen/teichoic acid export membrane protein